MKNNNYRLRIPALSLLWVHINGLSKKDAKERYIAGLYEKNPKVMWDDPNVLWEVEEIFIDRCAYCGIGYHPMPVYTNYNGRIWVCHYRFYDERSGEFDFHEVFECRKKAEAHGYQFRQDLTPRR